MKDWRGTEIEVGSLIMWATGNANWGIGTVKKIRYAPDKWKSDLIHCEPIVTNNPNSGRNLHQPSVTVLTEDLLELIPR